MKTEKHFHPGKRSYKIRVVGRTLVAAFFVIGYSLNAAEFTLLETATNHTASDEGSVEFQAGSETPANWISPENYLGGSAHFQLEILEKPSAASINYNVCIVQGNTSACTNPYVAHNPGFHQWSQPIDEWTNIENINWNNPLNVVLTVRDCDNNIIDPGEDDWCGAPLIGIYFPMTANFTAIMVSEGSTFSGWNHTPVFEPLQYGQRGSGFQLQTNRKGHVTELIVSNYTGRSASIHLYDTNGKLMQRWSQPGEGPVSHFPITLQSISQGSPSGVYYLQLRAGHLSESIGLRL